MLLLFVQLPYTLIIFVYTLITFVIGLHAQLSLVLRNTQNFFSRMIFFFNDLVFQLLILITATSLATAWTFGTTIEICPIKVIVYATGVTQHTWCTCRIKRSIHFSSSFLFVRILELVLCILLLHMSDLRGSISWTWTFQLMRSKISKFLSRIRILYLF